MKFGTLIEDSLKCHRSKFGVSNSIPLAPPSVQNLTHVYANNFSIVIFRHKNFPAILNFPKNLLLRTRPRRFIRFARKLNQIIFRPCWQKILQIKLIRQIICDKRANKFYVAVAKTLLRQYLRNALSYSNQTWYMSSQAWLEATYSVSAQRHLLVRRYEKLQFLLITSELFVQKS